MHRGAGLGAGNRHSSYIHHNLGFNDAVTRANSHTNSHTNALTNAFAHAQPHHDQQH